MNLAELKRKLIVGTALKMTFNRIGKCNLIGKVRYIVKTQGNGIYLNEDKTATKGSFLEFPKASLFEATEKGFKVFEVGERDLTPEEQKIMENEPKDDKQDEIDIMTDGSMMFYRRKRYYKESGYFYLFGTEKQAGKSFDFNEHKVRDDSIKGELSLEYEFI